MSTMTMPEEQRKHNHEVEEYQISGLKNLEHDDDEHGNSEEPADILEEASDEQKQHSESFFHRLISIVKVNPILYEPTHQAMNAREGGRKKISELWNRIKMELEWDGVTPIETVWKQLVDQYTKHQMMYSEDIGDEREGIFAAMDFLQPFVVDRKVQITPATSTSRRRVSSPQEYSDMPQNLTEDVPISESPQPPTIASHSSHNYVVVQPQIQQVGGGTVQKTIRAYHNVNQEAHITPTVRNARGMMQQQQQIKYTTKSQRMEPPVLQMVKKRDESSNEQITMMVDMTTLYESNNGQKMYRLMSLPSTEQQHLRPNHRNQHADIQYHDLEHLIVEGNGEEQQPPRKKMLIRESESSAAPASNLVPSANRVEGDTILAGGVPIGDDEIIDDGIQETTMVIDPDGHLHEESPLMRGSPDVMISGQSTSRSQQMAGGGAHDHRIQQDGGMAANVHQPLDEIMQQQNQYDADLQFQQLISSHLSRLNDDEKAVMKYNMQRILLEARFGEGTAKQFIDEELMENEAVHHQDIETTVDPNTGEIQQRM